MQVDAPVERQDRSAGIRRQIDDVGPIVDVENERCRTVRERLGDAVVGGLGEALVGLAVEQPRPGIEELDGLGAGLDANGLLTEEAALRGLDCLQRSRESLHALAPSQVRAFFIVSQFLIP